MGHGRGRGHLGVLILVILAVGATPHDGSSHAHTDVQGSVLAEAPTADAARCAWLEGGEGSQGMLGWVVTLAPDEGDGQHMYELFQEGTIEHLDVTFYADLGTCQSGGSRLADVTGPTWTETSVLGEVPPGARYAVIGRWGTHVGGPTYAIPPFYAYLGAGADVDFRFSVHDVPMQGALSEPFDGDPATTESLTAGRPGLTVELSRARFGWKNATHAVLSRMDVFADSLAGSALTADGPLLGVWTDELPPEVAEELRRVVPTGATVYLLGGSRAISRGVERDVAALGYEVRRLAGADRVDTAIAVADEVRTLYPSARDVGLARAFGAAGDDSSAWVDSVTAGGLAAARGMPVLLTRSVSMDPAVAGWLSRDAPERTVLFGGETALSQSVEESAPNAHRIWGADRAGTAARIAEELLADVASGERRFVIVNGWSGQGWLGGMAAAGVTPLYDAPILLVSGGDVPEATARLVSHCGVPEVDLLVSGSSDDPAVGVTPEVIGELDRLDGRAC